MARQAQFDSVAAQLHAPGYRTATTPGRTVAVTSGNELALKWLIFAFFLPEGFSFFIGDFRLSLARVLIVVLLIQATTQYFRKIPRSVFVPSDLFAIAAGFWMVLAASVMQGPVDGLKSGGILALEFTGSYCIFRNLLGPIDSSVRVVTFACKLLFLIVPLAVLDPLSGKLFTYEFAKALTGYASSGWEWAKGSNADTMFRNGLVRAMGPLEHSILFGTACAWVGTLAICMLPSRLLGWSLAATAVIGILVSQARGPLLAYVLSLALVVFYYMTIGFKARWKMLLSLLLVGIVVLCVASGNPLATLLGLTGIDETTRWHRQAIWEAVVPMLLDQSPIFGLGIRVEWDWQRNGLFGESVDAVWLRIAMTQGIPASFLVMLTLIGGYWSGPLDRSPYLTREEGRLSVALGIVTFAAIFLGFTVHFWGTCWILMAVFAGTRANLVEARVNRQRAARVPIEQ
jgi:O-antigen ligase